MTDIDDRPEADRDPPAAPADATAQASSPEGDGTPAKGRKKKRFAPRRAGARGWGDRYCGTNAYVEAAPEWRGTSVQVCGLWPFIAGSGAPMVGVPLGKHLYSGTTVCSDPINWFTRAKLISNPGVMVLGLTGRGKALDLETPVPTPAGWRRFGDLGPGDWVFDAQGAPTPVVAVSEVWEDRPCYEVRFSDGSRIVADAEHLWVTTDRAARARLTPGRVAKRAGVPVGDIALRSAVAAAAATSQGAGGLVTRAELGRELGLGQPEPGWDMVYRWAKAVGPVTGSGRGALYQREALLREGAARLGRARGSWQVTASPDGPITTEEMGRTLRSNGRWNHAVATTGPLQLEDRQLPVDPYVLGLWLGDGTRGAAAITTADAEVVESIRSAGYDVRKTTARYGYSVSVPGHRHKRHTSLAGLLRGLGVIDEKAVPDTYLWASETQRRALLAGLLDSDGTATPDGRVQFVVTSEKLARGAHMLACSLGFRPTLRSGIARLEGRDCGTKWVVTFTTSDEVFRLTRKRLAHQTRRREIDQRRTKLRYVVGVEPVASRPVRCIQVGCDSGVFLAGETMIPTHNSSIVRRMATGLAAQGVNPLVFGDLKPDYADLVVALGGNVVRLGRGEGGLNVLDPGAAMSVAARLSGAARGKLEADAKGRRLNILCGLIELNRQRPVTDVETLVLDTAMEVLDRDRPPGEAVLGDLIALLESGPEELRAVTLSRSNEDAYHWAIDPLQGSLLALTRGALGETFARRTSVALDLSRPLCIDISGIPESDSKLQAAVLLACWAEGFAALEAAQALADDGQGPQRNAFLVIDELWRVMGAAKGMVARVDALTRLNRTRGVGQALITHTLSDMLSLADEDDRQRAAGFAERAGYMILGGLPKREMPMLTQVVQLSRREADLLDDWSSPPTWDPERGAEAEPPGRGRFLLKVGGRPGIPIRVELTESERDVHDTNQRWREAMGR